MRNPLAEPGLLGINAGAALAAMVVIVQVETVPERLLPVVTFAGAVGMTVAIFLLAWRQGTTSLRLILIGVGLSALAGAGASFISTFGDISLVQRAMVWLSGSLQDSRWIKVETLFAWAAVPMSARPADGVLLVVACADAASVRTAARVVVASPPLVRSSEGLGALPPPQATSPRQRVARTRWVGRWVIRIPLRRGARAGARR